MQMLLEVNDYTIRYMRFVEIKLGHKIRWFVLYIIKRVYFTHIFLLTIRTYLIDTI